MTRKASGADALRPGNALPSSLLAVVVASALLQLAVLSLPDTMGDLLNYRLWARTLARDGLAEAYWPSQPLVVRADRLDAPIDYPPIVPYLLLAAGKLGAALSLSDARLDSLIRVPFALANLAVGLLLFADARRHGRDATAVLVASLYLLNPAVLFDTVYWGQADSLVALFVVGAVVALGSSRPEWAWASFALAVLTKPLAYPLTPLLLLVTIKRFGAARAVRCALAFLATAALALLPFLWTARLGRLLRSLFLQLDAMPYASVNAHNLWWLVQGGTPFQDAREKPFGLLSYEAMGLLLLAAFFLATLVRAWRSSEERSHRLAFASAAFGFFMLATHMHENHSFTALPLLLLVGVDDPRVRRFFLLVSAMLLVNLLLHDPYLTHVVRPWVPGPHLLLPQQRGLDPGFFDYFRAQGYPHLVDQIRGETSLLGALLTLLNAQAATLVFAWWLWAFYSRPTFDRALLESESRVGRRYVLSAVLLFLAVTGLPFLTRAFREDRQGRTPPVRSSRLPGDPRAVLCSSSPVDRRSARS